MTKNITITEAELREIIREEIKKALINEGIDIRRDDKKRFVSVNNSHPIFVC